MSVLINLYSLDDAEKIISTKKRYQRILMISALLVLVLIILLACFMQNYVGMFVSIVLASGYLWFLYTYYFYHRNNLNERYHMLAKIEQFTCEEVVGKITDYDDNIITINTLEAHTITINHKRIVYLELNHQSTIKERINMEMKLKIVDNFIVGYEEIGNE